MNWKQMLDEAMQEATAKENGAQEPLQSLYELRQGKPRPYTIWRHPEHGEVEVMSWPIPPWTDPTVFARTIPGDPTSAVYLKVADLTPTQEP